MLEDHFRKYFQEIRNANVILDSQTKRSKGYGFVTLSCEADYRKAIEQVNGSVLKGRQIVVRDSFQRKKLEPEFGDK